MDLIWDPWGLDRTFYSWKWVVPKFSEDGIDGWLTSPFRRVAPADASWCWAGSPQWSGDWLTHYHETIHVVSWSLTHFPCSEKRSPTWPTIIELKWKFCWSEPDCRHLDRRASWCDGFLPWNLMSMACLWNHCAWHLTLWCVYLQFDLISCSERMSVQLCRTHNDSLHHWARWTLWPAALRLRLHHPLTLWMIWGTHRPELRSTRPLKWPSTCSCARCEWNSPFEPVMMLKDSRNRLTSSWWWFHTISHELPIAHLRATRTTDSALLMLWVLNSITNSPEFVAELTWLNCWTSIPHDGDVVAWVELLHGCKWRLKALSWCLLRCDHTWRWWGKWGCDSWQLAERLRAESWIFCLACDGCRGIW